MIEFAKPDRSGLGVRTALYCRVSTAGQEDNASLATQEEACRTHAADRGWAVTATFREVHTGVELFERPQLALLRDAMRKREIGAVICYSTDRLSRDPVHLGLVQYEATYYGIELAFVTDTYDTSLEGQMLAMVRGMAGRIEHERIRERTKRGKQARLAKGFPNVGNKAPYGYIWNNYRTKLLIDPIEAERVREAFNRIATGTSVNALCREWNERGVPSPAGRTWVPPTLRDIIDKDVYIGRLVAQRTEVYYETVPGIGRVKKRRSCEGIVLPDAAPAIVSEELALAARRQKFLNKKRSKRNTITPSAALLRGGYVRCGLCGWSMHALRRTIRGVERTDYVCPNQWGGCPYHAMPAPKLDQAVGERVEDVLTRPEIVAAQLELQRGREFDISLILGAEKRVRDAEKKRDRIISAMTETDDDDLVAVFRDQAKTLQAEVSLARDMLDALRRERADWEQGQQQLDELQLWLERVARNVETLDYDGKRLALDALGVQVRLWEKTHEPRYEITMHLDPSASMQTVEGSSPARSASASRSRGPCTRSAGRSEPR
jgi:site-specific DNA recombinase